jgi:hypothetical protein
MNSSPADVETLAARVEKLEAANRRWKSASVIALLFVISMLLLSTRHAERVRAAAKPDRVEPDVLHVRTVEARDFVLKDLDGHVYGRLGITPSLTAMDQNGRSVRLYDMPVIPGQASLQFYDEKGKVVWSAPSKPQFMTVR